MAAEVLWQQLDTVLWLQDVGILWKPDELEMIRRVVLLNEIDGSGEDGIVGIGCWRLDAGYIDL